MELKEFVTKCLSQIADGIKDGGGNFALKDDIQFDVPLNTASDTLSVDSAGSAPGLPRVTFSVKRPMAFKTK